MVSVSEYLKWWNGGPLLLPSWGEPLVKVLLGNFDAWSGNFWKCGTALLIVLCYIVTLTSAAVALYVQLANHVVYEEMSKDCCSLLDSIEFPLYTAPPSTSAVHVATPSGSGEGPHSPQSPKAKEEPSDSEVIILTWVISTTTTDLCYAL